MGSILVGIALIIIASKIGPALAQRVAAGGDTDLARRLRQLDARVAETEERLGALANESNERLVDIEERVDFTERVLQQQRDRGQLPPLR
jgi:hypothetical protein